MKRALPWAVPALVLLAWQVGSAFGIIADNVLPAPTEVADAGWRLARSGELLRNIGISAWRALAGFAVGGSVGLALGMLNGISSLSESLTDSTLQMVRNIPHLALIPLVILWFGIGDEARVFLVALGVFFPMYVNTQHGIRSVDPHLLEMGRAYGMSERELLQRVVLPGALPSIFVGLRYGLGIMWLTLIVAETISASSGIGYMAMNAREFMLVDVVVFLNRVLHTVNGGEVVERFPGRDSLGQSIDRRPRPIRQEHRPRLRPQVEQMTGAVVFLVATRVLVLANDIAVVIVDGKATSQTDLGMTAHAQPIDVESRRLLDKQRCRGFQPLKVLHPRGIDIVSVKIGSQVEGRSPVATHEESSTDFLRPVHALHLC